VLKYFRRVEKKMTLKSKLKMTVFNSINILDVLLEQGLRKGLNLGAGQNWWHFNWKGIDKLDGNFLNENSVLPYEDNSIKYIYSSHFFEHISNECAENLFKEIKRVLRKDGLCRIVVPDYESLHMAIINDDLTLMESTSFKGWDTWEKFNIKKDNINFILHWFANHTNYPEEEKLFMDKDDFFRGPPVIPKSEVIKAAKNMTTIEFGEWVISHVDNDLIGFGGHINIWTHQKLIKFFSKIGMISCKSIYGNSKSKVMSYFDYQNDRSIISLCHEARFL
tara:strand:- start:1922 stop:2755 length:834 start_codon:yes stop_codon:yes gene_type:complete